MLYSPKVAAFIQPSLSHWPSLLHSRLYIQTQNSTSRERERGESEREMGVDLRQVVAGILTVTMFVMLGNMIKREHFDSAEKKLPGVREDTTYDSSEHVITVTRKNAVGPWKEDDEELKRCWSNPNLASDDSKGFITFSLTNGPEYHVSQVADAVVAARHLGATLVLPDIRGSEVGDKRSFGDIYDVHKFIRSLNGVVKIARQQPSDLPETLAVVKVPNRVTRDHVIKDVEPIFKKRGSIRLATYFPSVNMRGPTQKSETDSIACLAMFSALELRPEVQEVVDSIVERLRALSRKSDGQFLAVDIRVEMLSKKSCQTGRSCYGAREIAEFLQKVGFDKDTTIYLTQSRWDNSLNALKDIFPKTYTKEGIVPADKKAKFLGSENSEFEKVIDYYICAQSDVFVPAISGLFYANVAGKRIASGKTQILVPTNIKDSSAPPTEFISSYVAKKNHLAYSCFC
ncbi:protein MANNAN SYNTHESIS-RELATED 1-like isoform X2 [Punica granatum]|uniref:O-fucosyltransferase family protein n=1 Tax=Punica granatum TaxID=22663 RepID=A0A6P8CWT4_PUNGR|nr:protein MANNAN SYNTHESIS-RELATED 1-like isoform X2 [Punica granatum]